MIRAATVMFAMLLALAGLFAPSARQVGACGAGVGARGGLEISCCGDDCRCGDDCACAARSAPADSHEEGSAPSERSRGERLVIVAAPIPSPTLVARATPVDLGRPPRADSGPAAVPCCRLRLALISRWTT